MYHISRKTDKPDIKFMVDTITKLMDRGIRIADSAKFKEYYSNLSETLCEDIKNKYNILNPNSPAQVASYIEYMSSRVEANTNNDILNICYDDRADKWTSKAEALQKLDDLGYDFAEDILNYRHAKKYAEIIDSINSAKDQNGLIHPAVSTSKTNRISYSKPGLMQIPKKLLWHLVTPYTQGNVLYSIDIKNQEPGILINMIGSEELKSALMADEGLYENMFKKCFKQYATANVLLDTLPEDRVYSIDELNNIGVVEPAYYLPVKPFVRDVYYNGVRVVEIETICIGGRKGKMPELPSTVSLELENGNVVDAEVEWEDASKKLKRSSDYTLTGDIKGISIIVGKAERKEFKTAWLAISYGASEFGIRQSCRIIDGNKVYNYITKINELREYRNAIYKKARALDNWINTIFGTPMYADEESDTRKLNRILLDLPIQGSGADILSLLIKHFYDYINENDLVDKLSLYYTRHDELIIEVNKDYIESTGDKEVERVLRDIFEHQIDDWVPFKIDVEKTEAEDLGIDIDEDD